MNELDTLRKQIDGIDAEMAGLFEKRMAAVARVAAYKKEQGLPVLDAGREQAVLARNARHIQSPALAGYYASFLKGLMALSRQYQQQILGRGTVAYQGAEGGFGHLAMEHLFPASQPLAKATFAEVFEAVDSGEAAFGIVPFENSGTGDVSGILDLCYTHRSSISAMYDLPVSQNLLGLPGAVLGDIKTVVSHTQALQQSRRFIASLGAAAVPYANTALAAQHVAEKNDKSTAAVGSLQAAERYGLVPLAKDIADEAENTTRFAVLSARLPEKGNRFSLLVTVENKVGRLAKVIETIAAKGFDMESIKSRPIPHRPWEYFFYIELVGEARTDQAAVLLENLRAACLSVRLLGVFNRG